MKGGLSHSGRARWTLLSGAGCKRDNKGTSQKAGACISPLSPIHSYRAKREMREGGKSIFFLCLRRTHTRKHPSSSSPMSAMLMKVFLLLLSTRIATATVASELPQIHTKTHTRRVSHMYGVTGWTSPLSTVSPQFLGLGREASLDHFRPVRRSITCVLRTISSHRSQWGGGGGNAMIVYSYTHSKRRGDLPMDDDASSSLLAR